MGLPNMLVVEEGAERSLEESVKGKQNKEKSYGEVESSGLLQCHVKSSGFGYSGDHHFFKSVLQMHFLRMYKTR